MSSYDTGRKVAIAMKALLSGQEVTVAGGAHILAKHPKIYPPVICFKLMRYKTGEDWNDPAAGEVVYLGGDDLPLNWVIKELSDLPDAVITGLAAQNALDAMKARNKR